MMRRTIMSINGDSDSVPNSKARHCETLNHVLALSLDVGPVPATGNEDSRPEIGIPAEGLGGGDEGSVEKVSHSGTHSGLSLWILASFKVIPVTRKVFPRFLKNYNKFKMKFKIILIIIIFSIVI